LNEKKEETFNSIQLRLISKLDIEFHFGQCFGAYEDGTNAAQSFLCGSCKFMSIKDEIQVLSKRRRII
jgi:hypothetical protein